jgi:glucose/arabinose dehydrogenase
MAAVAAGCGSEASGRGAPEDPEAGPPPAAAIAHHFDLQTVASGFRQAVQVISRPGNPRLYVVEQGGTVRGVVAGQPAARPLLDLRRMTRARGEQGLLSAVFSPDGRAIVALFTDRVGDTRVASFPLTRNVADRERGRRLLAVPQPYVNHNGGTVLYDDRGRLLVGLGDGGNAYDPGQRAQRRRSLLGGILRRENGRWTKVALGLRNPWRMAFDTETGRLWIGDVGQGRAEEVNAAWLPEEGQSLLNFGWAAYEGRARLRGKRREHHTRLVWPLAAYDHDDGRCSITGGQVYRGERIPALRGRYVYGDFCRGTIWSLDARATHSGRASIERANLPGLSSFGADNAGELYAVGIGGVVMRLAAPGR